MVLSFCILSRLELILKFYQKFSLLFGNWKKILDSVFQVPPLFNSHAQTHTHSRVRKMAISNLNEHMEFPFLIPRIQILSRDPNNVIFWQDRNKHSASNSALSTCQLMPTLMRGIDCASWVLDSLRKNKASAFQH